LGSRYCSSNFNYIWEVGTAVVYINYIAVVVFLNYIEIVVVVKIAKIGK
jgi:hypothetical protein